MNQLARIPNTEVATRFAPDQVDLIKRTICKGSTDDELKLFMHQCERTGLDPFARQIYSIERREKRGESWVTVRSIQTSIDGFRLIAERTGKYAGQVGPFWCGEDGQWLDVWIKKEPPKAARVGILRSDFKEPCWGVARFDAYAQRGKDGLTRMWANMGDVMIAKCAEALGLRKAFPQELSGLYTSDEMDQATSAADTQPKPEPVKLAPAPATVPHDPKTGEIIESADGVPTFLDRRSPARPMKLAVPTKEGAADWIGFGQAYIAAIKTAPTLDQADEWDAANQAAMYDMRQDAPKVFARMQNAVAQHRASIAKPEDMGLTNINAG